MFNGKLRMSEVERYFNGAKKRKKNYFPIKRRIMMNTKMLMGVGRWAGSITAVGNQAINMMNIS